MKTQLLNLFEKNVIKKGLISKNGKILIAVSGGVDSIVLLDLFVSLKEKYKLELGVVHINHGLRRKESDEDEKFVKDLSNSYGIKCFVKSVKIKKQYRTSLQEFARKLRYKIFEKVLEENGFRRIATAHHLDDQAETILSRFISGSGTKGLSGIPEKRGVYIRPLLFATKDEIKNYANEKGLNFREDSSNLTDKYQRNKIRHKLIPFIELNFNPNVKETLSNEAEIFRETEEVIQTIMESAFKYCLISEEKDKIMLEINKIKSYFSIIQKRILLKACEKILGDTQSINFQNLNDLVDFINQGSTGKQLQLSDNLTIKIDRKKLIITKGKIKNPKFSTCTIIVGKSYNNVRFSFSSKILLKKPTKLGEDKSVEFVDGDLIKGKLFLRHWRKGDKFFPLGMNKEKKMSDFFIDEKVSRDLKNDILILENNNKIVWICGYRIDNRFKITDKTKRFLRLECRIK